MDSNELSNRRSALVSKMRGNSIAILSSANKTFRTNDVENPFRQNSDFLYINGLNEPNLISLVFKEKNKVCSVLFRNNTSEHEKIWEGDRLDNDEVKKKYDFSKIHSMSDYEDLISGYINNKEIIYIEQGLNCKLDNLILKKSKKMEKTSQIEIIPLSSITHKLTIN